MDQALDSASVSRWHARAALAALLVVVCLIYGRTLAFDFVWDDHQLVRHNALVTGQRGASDIWRTHLFEGAQPGTPGTFYRPLVIMSYRGDWALYGAPWGFHLTNVLLHFVTTLCVLLAVRRFGARWSYALAAALLFALWSGHSEPVSWISARTDLLLACGAALALLCVLHLLLGTRSPRLCLAFLPLACAIALFSKESALLLPPLLAGLLLLRRSLLSRARLIWALGGLLLPMVAYLAMRSAALGGLTLLTDQAGDQSAIARLARFGHQLELLFGLDLRAVVEFPASSYPLYATSGALGLLASLAAIAVLIRRRRYELACILGLALAALVPAATARLPALRYLYLPLAFTAVACGALLEAVSPRWRPRAWLAMGVMALLWLAFGQVRLGAWQDDGRFFATEAALSPRNPDALCLYGQHLLERGKLLQAAIRFRTGIDSDRGHRASWLGLGRALLMLRDYRAAENVARKSLRGEPRTYPQYTLLGHALFEQSKYEPALAAYQQALALNPTSPHALRGAAKAADRAGHTALAQTFSRRLERIETR